jgi:hypothetical protein
VRYFFSFLWKRVTPNLSLQGKQILGRRELDTDAVIFFRCHKPVFSQHPERLAAERNRMGKFSDCATGVGIPALLLLIDFLKGKTKKQLLNNNRPGRDVTSMDG